MVSLRTRQRNLAGFDMNKNALKAKMAGVLAMLGLSGNRNDCVITLPSIGGEFLPSKKPLSMKARRRAFHEESKRVAIEIQKYRREKMVAGRMPSYRTAAKKIKRPQLPQSAFGL